MNEPTHNGILWCGECVPIHGKHAAECPKNPDMLVAHHVHRKCDAIVEKTMTAFRAAVEEWGTLSLDECFAIGLQLVQIITVQPWEKAAKDEASKVKMRKEIGRQLRRYIEDTGETN